MKVAERTGSLDPVVIDTHIWLWLINGVEIDSAAMQRIVICAREGLVFVPSISVWEIAMLESRGRITLSQPLHQWIELALRAPGLRLIPLSPDVAVESCKLPEGCPADPADRMIVATARIEGASLVTRDEKLLQYGKQGHVKVLKG